MRILTLCLLAFALAGCSTQHTATPAANSSDKRVATTPVKVAPVIEHTEVRLYNNAEELVGKPFRDLGEVSGSLCQMTVQDPPPNLMAARKRMQNRASYMKANAVLLHDCQIVTSVAGCYQQAICQGSALNVSSQ